MMSVLSVAGRTLRPRICLSRGRAVYVGPGLDLAPHCNAAATLAIALDEPFALMLMEPSAEALAGAGSEAYRYAALIPPSKLHRLRARGPMLFLYLDALSDDFDAIAKMDLAAARARLLSLGAMPEGLDAIVEAIGVPRRDAPDTRLLTIIRRIDERPQDFERLDDAARLVGLSPSWFQTLFRRAVGMPFRRYRLWRRMAVVMQAIAGGENFTAAAHGAGFASSAHLSTAFRAMFGLAPSDLLRLGIEIEIGAAEDWPAAV